MLTKEINLLRQYLRALTNDQLLGDEVTRAALAELDLEPFEALPEAARLPLLFRSVYDIWRSAHEKAQSAGIFSTRAILQSVSPEEDLSRQVLLMVDVMGFPLSVAAEIAGQSLELTEAFLDAARERVDKPIEGTAIIIEDEPLIAEEIADLVTQQGVEVVGKARTKKEAVSLASRVVPRILLADYDLGGGETGLDAVKEITGEQDCVAIFITAYPDDVLTGEDFEPAFVISKPYRDRAVKAALWQALTKSRAALVE